MTEATKQLTADDILAASDLEIREVHVPEWNGSVYMRVLPADEGLELNEKMLALSKEKGHEAIFLLLASSLVTSAGERLFTAPDQIARLRSRSQKVLIRLQKIALTLQGWSEEEPVKNV